MNFPPLQPRLPLCRLLRHPLPPRRLLPLTHPPMSTIPPLPPRRTYGKPFPHMSWTPHVLLHRQIPPISPIPLRFRRLPIPLFRPTLRPLRSPQPPLPRITLLLRILLRQNNPPFLIMPSPLPPLTTTTRPPKINPSLAHLPPVSARAHPRPLLPPTLPNLVSHAHHHPPLFDTPLMRRTKPIVIPLLARRLKNSSL